MNFRSETPPQGGTGALVAIGLILALCFVSLAVGQVFVRVLAGLAPAFFQERAWFLLIFTVLALIPLLLVFIRLFPWLQSWYYLLPAVVSLLAFTIYPIAMTIYYAFTNYSAQNSGRPDSSTQIEVKKLDAITLTITAGNAFALRCAEGANCKGDRLELRRNDDSVQGQDFAIESALDNTIKLAQPMPEGLQPEMARKINPVSFVGVKNFSDIAANAGVQLWPVFRWTLLFAFFTTVINVIVGLTLGILLNNKRLKFRNFYRAVLILPWAIPIVISSLMWATLLGTYSGGINRFLAVFGTAPIPWLEDGLWAKMAVLMVNLWLGFPFMMTATLGALAAIPDDLYEAAEVDGATRWQQVKGITLPMLQAAFIPITLSTFAYNFNNFGLIYLLTKGGPVEPENMGQLAQSTDILLSWGYKFGFSSGQDGGQAYGMASAVAIIVGILTVGISLVNFRVAGVFKEARQ